MRKIIFFCLLILSCSSTVRYSNVESSELTENFIIKEIEVEDDIKVSLNDVKSLSYSEIQEAIVREVLNYIGIPYRKGGNGDKGIDCSAFVMIVFKNVFGIVLPRSSFEQFKIGKLIRNLDSLKVGDLLFFNTTGRVASHVGIYIGNGLFAHASVKDGVTVSSIYSTYYRKRFNGAKRIIEVGSN
ncbi:C40 family peptidase [Candidatus Kryptobacter tengchongensis]|nr:NlpC/P60 family protein [Candidatus Kryptobacter tengchongensis]CUS77804.1 lipoprotein Spr [Candidatus Kryptobacter tengchongensis]CUU09093.1 lipoprotein Spr [Candidatus Kryptobacter tengchongensis]